MSYYWQRSCSMNVHVRHSGKDVFAKLLTLYFFLQKFRLLISENYNCVVGRISISCLYFTFPENEVNEPFQVRTHLRRRWSSFARWRRSNLRPRQPGPSPASRQRPPTGSTREPIGLTNKDDLSIKQRQVCSGD